LGGRVKYLKRGAGTQMLVK